MFWKNKKDKFTDDKVIELMSTVTDYTDAKVNELSEYVLNLEEFVINIYANYTGLLSYLLANGVFTESDMIEWKKRMQVHPEIVKLFEELQNKKEKINNESEDFFDDYDWSEDDWDEE